jgi:hypothetical protein
MIDNGIKAIGGRKRSDVTEKAWPAPAALMHSTAVHSKAFDDFAACVRSPNLRAVIAHWAQARGAQTMPSWEQLRPARIVHQLPLIWAYRYDQESETFAGRLAGDKICQIFGKNIRGRSLDEIFPPDVVGWTQRLYSRVVQEPALYRSTGHVFSHLRRGGVGERIILPLSSDGITGDGILGATDYQYPHPSAPGGPEVETETERWFCLRPERSSADPH